MKFQKYLVLIFMSMFLVSSVSALTTYAVFGDGTKAKTIEYGTAVSFEVDFFSMNPSMSLIIEVRDSSDNLVYTILNTTTSSKTNTGVYSLNDSVYSGVGGYSIIAKGTDSVGSSQFDSLSVNVIDTTSPTGAISYPIDSTTYSANISKLEFTGTDLNLAKCEYSTDNGVTKTTVACTSGSLTTVALNSVEGANKWIVYLTDISGNTISYSVSFTVKSSIPIDSATPLISILGPINGTTYSTQVKFLNFIATDPNLKKCEYSTDNGVTKTAVACTSGSLTTVALNSVEGANKWIIYAEDTAGNRHSNYTEFTVNSLLTDTTAPTITILSPEDKEYNLKKLTFKVTTDENSTVKFSLDGKDKIMMNNPYDHVFTYTLTLSDDKHTVTFYATDSAGNVATKTIKFVMDYSTKSKDRGEDKEDELPESDSVLNQDALYIDPLKDYRGESRMIYLSRQETKVSFFENVRNFFANIWEMIINLFRWIF